MITKGMLYLACSISQISMFTAEMGDDTDVVSKVIALWFVSLVATSVVSSLPLMIRSNVKMPHIIAMLVIIILVVVFIF